MIEGNGRGTSRVRRCTSPEPSEGRRQSKVGIGKTRRCVLEPMPMNESFAITPGRSVGPFALGMPRFEIWTLNRCPVTSFYKTPASERRTDDFTLLGIHVYYDENDCANYIEAHTSVQHNEVTLILDGKRINSLFVGELREICSMWDCSVEDCDCGFDVPTIGLSIYSHEYEDDHSKVDAVSVMPPTSGSTPRR